MYFDRFDICEAHYMFAMLWHDGMWGEIYGKFGQLERNDCKKVLKYVQIVHQKTFKKEVVEEK
jgi:hypothetical protein